MELPKIFITTNQNIFEWLLERFNLILLKREDNISVYKPWLTNENVLVITWEDTLINITNYLFDNYLFDEIIYIWTSKILSNIDIREWDVVIPNTFITDKSDFVIFSTKITWESYDLRKFWLILSWVNLTRYKNETWENTDFEADTIDNEVYDFVKIVKDRDSLEKTTILKIIGNEDSPIIKESIVVIDFFL